MRSAAVPGVHQNTQEPRQTAPVSEGRYELEWLLPLEPGLFTHVTLFDLEQYPPEAVAGGHGADEAEALLELWRTLTARPDSADAISVVAEAYSRRTGRAPGAT